MTGAITAAAANREFSSMLRRVRSGRTYIVTSHGRPVARIVPYASEEPIKASARRTLFARLASARVTDVGRWTRDELYED